MRSEISQAPSPLTSDQTRHANPVAHDISPVGPMTPPTRTSLVRQWSAPHPTDLKLTLSALARGRGDPTVQILPSGFWRATRTPEGPGTQRIRTIASDRFEVTAWGPGAQWLIDRAPVLTGANDDHDGFPTHHEEMYRLHRSFQRMRTPCSQSVFEALFPTILEQKVTGREALSSYGRLVRYFGEPAPSVEQGPRLLLPPNPKIVEGTPTYVFHRANVERKRSSAIKVAASYAHRLEAAASTSDEAVRLALSQLPGVGPWSIAEVMTVAAGDADSVSVGDFHLKNWVSWNLVGEPRGTDEQMLQLLEPFRPFRGRVARLLQLGGSAPPKYGPRLTIQRRW